VVSFLESRDVRRGGAGGVVDSSLIATREGLLLDATGKSRPRTDKMGCYEECRGTNKRFGQKRWAFGGFVLLV
jgi:hypothetical protein